MLTEVYITEDFNMKEKIKIPDHLCHFRQWEDICYCVPLFFLKYVWVDTVTYTHTHKHV